MKKRLVSCTLICMLLLQLVSNLMFVPAADAAAGPVVTVTLDTPGKVELGGDTTLEVTLQNGGTWAYNAGIELLLTDGLKVADSNSLKSTSETPNSTTGELTVYWKDIKDLAPNEKFTFPIKLTTIDKLRKTGADTDFGQQVNAVVSVYTSNDARQLYEPPNTPSGKSDVKLIKIVPFTVKVIEPEQKLVKGAGPDAAPPAAGDEWGAYKYKIEIVNNKRANTNFTVFENRIDDALEAYGYSINPNAQTVTGNKRVANWNNSLILTSGETKTIEFNAAFLETPNLKDDGSTRVTNTIQYTGVTNKISSGTHTETDSINYYSIPKDVIISKSVDKETTGYGEALTYTLVIRSNEYYDVTNVTITDTVGDGQKFTGYTSASIAYPDGTSVSAAPTFATPARDTADGTTKLGWTVPDNTLKADAARNKGTVVTIKYTTEVENTWKAPSGGPVVAGDTIDNKATVTGTTTVSGSVSDSASTSVPIAVPKISETIKSVNTTALSSPNNKAADVTVGDKVTFNVKYDATGVNAKQHGVEIFDFLPYGTKLVDETYANYAMNGVTPVYNTGLHALIWSFSDIDELKPPFYTDIQVVVIDDAEYRKAVKGAENLVVLSYKNTAGRTQSDRDTVKLNFEGPDVVNQRFVETTDVSPGKGIVTVKGNQTVTVKIILTNNGKLPAYNVVLQETLPPELTFSQFLTDSRVTASGPAPGDSKLFFTLTSPLEPGASIDLIYEAKIIDQIGALKQIKQESSWDYYGQPSTWPVGEPRHHYTPTEPLHTTMQAQSPTITKKVVDTTTSTTSSPNLNVRAGDWVVYEVEAKLPDTETAYNATLTDFIPVRQSLLGVFSTWDPATHTGTSVAQSVYQLGGDATAGYTVTLPNLNVSRTAGGFKYYTYYIKTKVDKLTGSSELQKQLAKFGWTDENVGGTSNTIQSLLAQVTVNRPNLSADMSPASLPEVNKGEVKDITFTITNNGTSDAYDFVPTITLPAGFEFVNPDKVPAGDLETGYTITLDKRDLAPGAANKFIYPFKAKLIEVKGSGSSYQIIGRTGDYYVSHEVFTGGSAGPDEKYSQTQAQTVVGIPGVTLLNEIAATSNGSSKTEIRPGDTVDYKLTVQVPAGTKAYSLTVEDTFASIGNFEILPLPAGTNTDAVGRSWPGGGNKLVVNFGSPIDATAGARTLTETVRLRAKPDGTSPTSGTFTVQKATYTTGAIAKWSTEIGTPLQTNQVQTSIDVLQPNVTITAEPIPDPVFKDSNPTIAAGFTINNSGTSKAYNNIVEVAVPSGLQVSNISNGGTLANGNKVVWNIAELNSGASHTLTFNLQVTAQIGAGSNNLEVAAVLKQYASTPAAQPEQQAKVYTPNAPASSYLSIAPLTITAAITDNTFGPAPFDKIRPGDETTYEVLLNPPGSSAAFMAVLKLPVLLEQDIVSVTMDGQTVSFSPMEGGYPLGTAAGHKKVIVVARAKTNTNNAQNPYNAAFKPTVEYKTAASGGTALSATAAQLQEDVIEPNVAVSIMADKQQVLTPGEPVTFQVKVDNTLGLSTAYAAELNMTVANSVYLQRVGPSTEASDVITSDSQHFTWKMAAIPAGQQRQLTFLAGSKNSTTVTSQVYFEAELAKYFSLPSGKGKQYGPLVTNEVGVVVRGQHMLENSGTLSVTAGQDAVFNHILRNTGAGNDTFILGLIGAYPTDLYAGGQKIAAGKNMNGVWVWDSIDPLYNSGGNVAVTLDGGGMKDIKLVVHVPENTPYDNTNAQVYSLNAKAQRTGNVSTVQDYLKIAGSALDGWSGDQESAGWIMPAYGRGDSLFFRAVSAVHIAALKAYYTHGDKTGLVELQVQNKDTYIAKGSKQWSGTARLPVTASPGNYEVKFVALDALGNPLEIDDKNSTTGANNPFAVKGSVTVQGQIKDAVTNQPIAGAKVVLYHPASGQPVAETTTDAGGHYAFPDVKPGGYRLIVQKSPYAEAVKEFYALPQSGSDSVVVVDAVLTPYTITLQANPSTILGDGKSETELTVKITDAGGQPVAGAQVNFSSPSGIGSFPSGTTAVTNERGEAKLPYRSDAVSGNASKRAEVVANVQDPSRQLSADARIVITLDPGAIAGVVTEMVNGVPHVVAGAVVEVTKDLDGDGINDFIARAVTKEDGSYLIAVPVGNTEYDLTITKPFIIGNEKKDISFPQKAAVGTISPVGYEVYPATKTASGVLLVQTSGGQTGQFPAGLYSKMKGYLIDESGNYVTNPDGSRLAVTFGTNGSFNAQNLNAGTYQLAIAVEVAPGQELIINRDRNGNISKLQLQQNGEMNITIELIDPYGTVTDAKTGEVIENAHVELYYADTPRNKANGRNPGELVSLPVLEGFPPSENRNPQETDANGEYAYMVYRTTDYYVVVSKPGYYTYKSPILSVEQEIVRHDLQLVPIPKSTGSGSKGSGGGGGGGAVTTPTAPEAGNPDQADGQADLAVALMSDRATYPEGGIITFTIEYLNKSNVTVKGVSVQAQIPAHTKLVDAAGGTTDTDGTIRWSLGDLSPGASGKLVYKVQVQENGLSSAEQLITNRAQIIAADELVFKEDDQSPLQLLLFSSRFGAQQHKRYIAGYPDGLFKADRSITRAEIAAIFARIMDLQQTVKGISFYQDVTPSFWAAGYIEAATRAGLFGGYEDQSFLPDQPITRAELSTVLARYLKLQDRAPLQTHFADINGHWGRNAIEEIYRHHIIEGYPDGSFKPEANMIRSEAVTMINRLLYRGPLNNVEVVFPDMTPDHWAFGHVQESAVTHEYTRNPDGSETMTKLIPEPLW
ncbi:S-layer homology domain-containing protein [Paenibacillus piri]|uniref:DUF11 domain-containing protein n=1 Tax=Paenibacillus piri TaxID=2547395 RepID=A0A4R5KPJ1_9BACL|nr:S-layer homology domain-containing protein [Paenibacillus piri]TDF97232.1 DUF11 domain-containing protein [Paenibacillus piri]